MANFYYVKTGGTATGDAGRVATTKSTGSFAAKGASAYYDEVFDAILATTTPAAGDYVLISDAHAESGNGNISFVGSTIANMVATDIPLTFMTVEDANCDTYTIATSKQFDALAGSDITFTAFGGDEKKFGVFGIWVESQDDIDVNRESGVFFQDCTFRVYEAGDRCWAGDNSTFVDCTFKADHADAEWVGTLGRGTNGCDFRGCTFTTTAGSKSVGIVQTPESSRTSFEGCDFSTSKVLTLVEFATLAFSAKITFNRCQLPAELTSFSSVTPSLRGWSLTVTNCAATSADAEYQWYYEEGNNTAEDDTAFYRDSSTPFTESNQKVSIKMDTHSSLSLAFPFSFEFPTRYAELATASTDTLRLYLLSSDSGLTSADVWVDVIYPDGTNKHQNNIAKTFTFDPFAAGTALTANSDAWTGRTSETRYQIDIDTSSDVGADCVPIIRVHVAKPSITVYFDTSVGVVA